MLSHSADHWVPEFARADRPLSEVAKSMMRQTALILACRYGHDDVAYALLRHGADVQCEDERGMTALMWASRGGHELLIPHLLAEATSAYSYINAVDHDGTSALMHAAFAGHADTFDVSVCRTRTPHVRVPTARASCHMRVPHARATCARATCTCCVHRCSSTSVHTCSHLCTPVHICSHLFTSVHRCSSTSVPM